MSLLKAVLALALLGTSSALFATEDEAKLQLMWKNFKTEYNKVYESAAEEALRFKIFKNTLTIIDERNAAETGSATHGITKFADLSQEEFRARYLKTEAPADIPAHNLVSLPPMATAVQDWTGIYTTPVKNQGYCGSCWAFSVTEQLESDSMRQLKTNYILSPQELVSCDTSDEGCNGGWPTNAYQWIEKEGGLVAESDYPYTSGAAGVTGSCQTQNLSDKLITVTNYYQLHGESSMTAHTATTGPIAIAVDASQWSTYIGGILSKCGHNIDHAVQIVGVDTTEGYWKVRNSWGSTWGESGFIRLAYGQNTCGLTTIPTYVDTARA